MQSDPGLDRLQNISNPPELWIDQHHVRNDVANVIAFAKIRANEILTDNRLVMYILKEMEYGTKEQITSAFIQEVFQSMQSTRHPFVTNFLRYEIAQIKSTGWTIFQIGHSLWCHLLDACRLTTSPGRDMTIDERTISQLIVRHRYGDQEQLSALLLKLTDQRVSNDLLVALVEHQKDFAMNLYIAATQTGPCTLFWIRDQNGIMAEGDMD